MVTAVFRAPDPSVHVLCPKAGLLVSWRFPSSPPCRSPALLNLHLFEQDPGVMATLNQVGA